MVTQAIISNFLAIISVLLTVGKIVSKLWPWISDNSNTFPVPFSKTIKPDLKEARALSQEGFELLGKGIKNQAAKEKARILARKETELYFSPMMRMLVLMLVLLVGLFFLAATTKIHTVEVSEFYLLVLSIYLLVFLVFMVIAVPPLMYDVSNYPDMAHKLKDRKERKESQKGQLGLSCEKLITYVERHGSYVLIDARPQETRKRSPIRNAEVIPDSELREFARSLLADTASGDTVVFACSDFGKESYSTIKGLRGLGVKNSYDLGSIKGREILVDRAMRELSYRNLAPLNWRATAKETPQ
ncbi:MAG: rhodanese-like domain-containing protein [Eggerthellaceae bacterium]|nr:rhodanese-like domain-containing protein [Eggerthellaceae bacterium]